jgi:hypothetical protein
MDVFVTAAGPLPRVRPRVAKRAAPGSDEPIGAAGPGPVRRPRRRPRDIPARRHLIDEIDAAFGDDPGPGGWSGGFANQAHWDPARPRAWRCWAQSGPTWSAHCGAEVAANDTLGLCQRHRQSLLAEDHDAGPDEAPERVPPRRVPPRRVEPSAS